MAKHQERVIVDVRNLFPSTASTNSHTSTQPGNGETNSRTDISSHIHETPSTIKLNTDSNFILGSREKDLGFCQRYTDINQSRRRTATTGKHTLHEQLESDECEGFSKSNGNSSTSSPSPSFDVTAFMTAYSNNECNKKNPLFDVENKTNSYSISTPTENGNLQSLLKNRNSCSLPDENTVFGLGERTYHPDLLSKHKMEATHHTDLQRNHTIEMSDKNQTGDSISAKNKYNETHHKHDADPLMEEEVSMEFWEEEAEEQVPKLYTEYAGEDFSQYLNDDVTNGEQENENNKKGDKNRITHGTNLLEMAATGSVNSISSITPNNKKSPGVKTKFSRVFHFNSLNGKTSRPSEDSQNSIHSFSYSNTKIGTTRGKNSKSRPTCYFDSLSVNENISDWNDDSDKTEIGGQITKTAEGNSDVILRSRQPSASSSGGSMNSNSLFNEEDHKFEEFLKDDDLMEPDFESKRKRNLYNSRGREHSRKHGNLFKIKFPKRNASDLDPDIMNVVQNTVFNPLSDSSDVYL